MTLLTKIKNCFPRKAQPEHLQRGNLGERAAKKHLQKLGLKFLTANFRSARGEIDLVFREKARKGIVSIFSGNDSDCLEIVLLKLDSDRFNAVLPQHDSSAVQDLQAEVDKWLKCPLIRRLANVSTHLRLKGHEKHILNSSRT